MNINLPGCDLHECRYYFDGNCTKAKENKMHLYENCEYTLAKKGEYPLVHDFAIENQQLKEQIEKMKCCANCEFQYVRSLAAVIDDESDEPCCSCKEHSKWKLKV